MINHRLDKALAQWAQMLAEQFGDTLTVGEAESRQIAEAELTSLSQQTFLAASFCYDDHPDGDWQLLLSTDEAELLSRLLGDHDPETSLESLLETTCKTWLANLPPEFQASEVPRLLSVEQTQPIFRANLRTQVSLPLLVEGEPFFEVKAILSPSLYESLRRKNMIPEENPANQKYTSSVVFEPLSRRKTVPLGNGDIGLILDVPLELTVVLGSTTVMLDELIRLGEGSVLELDKLAGEPVELYVKDRLVGLAEVVVSDERFGIRILEMFESPRRYRSGAFASEAG